MECPKEDCGSAETIRTAISDTTHRYRCTECGYHFEVEWSDDGTDRTVKF